MEVKIGPYPKNSDKPRSVNVKIIEHDTWAAYQTIALVVVPLLKELKKLKHGSPIVDSTDLPPYLQYEEIKKEDEDIIHERWGWVLDEIIWSFEQYIDSDWDQQYFSGDFDVVESENGELNFAGSIDEEGIRKHRERIKNGLLLFAKYYDCLWT